MKNKTKTKKGSIEAQTYRTTVEQVQRRLPDGTPYLRLVDVETDAKDFHDEWDDFSDKDRDGANAWTAELHQARVAVAEAEPEVRAIQRYLEETACANGDYDAALVRETLAEAKGCVDDGGGLTDEALHSYGHLFPEYAEYA